MAEDILTTLQKEWSNEETFREVESLNGLKVKVLPLVWKDKQLLFKESEGAWPKIVLKCIKREDGAPLFALQDELKRPRNIEKILTEEIDPSILQELITLLIEQMEVEDVDKGKSS